MQDKTVFITGANGEMGQLLLPELKKIYKNIISLDISELDKNIKDIPNKFIKGSITDEELINKIFEEEKIDIVIHLAALLSTASEKNPQLAYDINFNGTKNLLDKALDLKCLFFFPSSIAVYSIPSLEIKESVQIREEDYVSPSTLYGISKVYGEMLGKYYEAKGLDFRSIRFPGLISATSVPSGGTSDFGPEMLHAFATRKSYECFVREDTSLCFMTMPDAVNSITKLIQAPKELLKSNVYNVSAFTMTAKEFEEEAKKYFGENEVNYKIDNLRQNIVDHWPKILNDQKARNDWGWEIKYNKQAAFDQYLIPAIKEKYNL